MKMHNSTVPTQISLLKQIISQANIRNNHNRQYLKKSIDKKYSQHIGMIQYNKMREERFIESQQKIIQKQNQSIERAKNFISLKQKKAVNNKNYSIVERSKRVQNQLNHWEKVVEKNKYQYDRRLKDSESLIKDWNDKLSSSSVRKSSILKNVSETMRERTSKGQRTSTAERQHTDRKQIENPQKEVQTREKISRDKDYRASRVSTQSMFDKKKKIQQQNLQKSLVQTIEKSNRINQARYLKHYIYERKRKQQRDKEQSLRRLRQNHLHELQTKVEERNKVLDGKYKNSHKKIRNKDLSLPSIASTKAIQHSSIVFGAALNQGPILKNQSRLFFQKQKSTQNILYEPYYDRMIMEKLRNVSLIMRQRHL